MRPLPFGLIVAGLAVLYCGFVAWRLMPHPAPHLAPVVPTTVDVEAVKSDVCRLAQQERRYLAATGHYATFMELRADNDRNLPLEAHPPYLYAIYVPEPDTIVIVASSTGPLGARPPALIADRNMQVCSLTQRLPRQTQALDDRSEKWGDPTLIEYECQQCR